MNRRFLAVSGCVLALLAISAPTFFRKADDGLQYPMSIGIPEDIPHIVWEDPPPENDGDGEDVRGRLAINGPSMYLRGHLAGWEKSLTLTSGCPATVDRSSGESRAIEYEFGSWDKTGIEVFRRGFRDGFDESQRRIQTSYLARGVVVTWDDVREASAALYRTRAQ